VPICGDGIVVGEEPCDDGVLKDRKGCSDDCNSALIGWNCTGGDMESPTNCTLNGGLLAASTIAQVSTYIGFAASIMTSVGSLSAGPGTFLIVNAIQIA